MSGAARTLTCQLGPTSRTPGRKTMSRHDKEMAMIVAMFVLVALAVFAVWFSVVMIADALDHDKAHPPSAWKEK